MKTNFFFIQTFSILVLFTFLFTSLANAQQRAQQVDKKPAITYCDDYIAVTKINLEKRANSTCATAKATVPCHDKKTGMPVHVTLVVQPEIKDCPNVVKIEDKVTDEPLSRGAAKTDFSVEVLQEKCSGGNGVTLSAYIPGYDATEKKKVYDFEWMTDGEVFDKDNEAECVSGNKITLKVKNLATDEMIVRSITIDANAANPEIDYKKYGFEKTACYGTCPVYKVAINKSGKATWTGIANVERTGIWEATIDEAKLKGLKEAIDKANYFELSRKYPIEGEIADASKTITYYRAGDTEMSVTHSFGGPDELVKFEEYLEKTIANLSWKKVIDRKSK